MWSGSFLGSPGVVGRPSWSSGSGWEALPEVWEWSEDFSGGPGVFGSAREASPKVREWSRGLPEDPGVVWRPFRRSGSGWEVLPDVRVCSGGQPEV